jgi:hypothetical protein
MTAALLVAATLIPGLTVQPVSRSALVRSAAASAVAAAMPPAFALDLFGAKEEKFVAKRATDVAQLVGSGGLSSYNQLKLKTALQELSEAPVPADIKPSVDVISTLLPAIMQSQVPDSSKISQATDAIAKLVLTDSLKAQAESIDKQSAGIKAGIAKSDANAAAIAATDLANELTEFCYAYQGAEKPLAELRKGVPDVYDKSRSAIDLPVSGKSL